MRPGPLLYHFADMEHEMSIELAYDELKATFPLFGLKLVKEETGACVRADVVAIFASVWRLPWACCCCCKR